MDRKIKTSIVELLNHAIERNEELRSVYLTKGTQWHNREVAGAQQELEFN